MDEQKLLVSLKKKKRGALNQAIEQYTPYIYCIVHNVIGRVLSHEDVEEVVSDVFISLWKNSENLDDAKGSVRAYLGAAARNGAKNKLKGLKMETPFEECMDFSTNTPEIELEKQERKAILWEAISELGEPDSEIFLRYYQYDEKIREIAQNTGLCAATVKTKLFRGRQKLREKFLESE